jgi:hypothetical protein
MNTDKAIDTLLTTTFGILGVHIAGIEITADIYAMFVQSLIATAAIGRLAWDILKDKKKDERE